MPVAPFEPRPPGDEELLTFYENAYAHEGEKAQLYNDWRTLGAIGKADHVIELCSSVGMQPRKTLEIGCGDGALLSELSRRKFGGSLHGVEIAQAAVDIASRRDEIDSVELYDGRSLRFDHGEYELGILSHVLEHVPEPALLLKEVARACDTVVVEVPLEHNLSARRAAKRAHAEEVGHLHRLSRASTRSIVERAGLRVVGEIEDPLPLRVHLFFSDSHASRIRGRIKWAMRTACHRLAPPLARRLFTLHYACICVR